MPSGTGFWRKASDWMKTMNDLLGTTDDINMKKQSVDIASVIHGDDPSGCFYIFSRYLRAGYQVSIQGDRQDSRCICR